MSGTRTRRTRSVAWIAACIAAGIACVAGGDPRPSPRPADDGSRTSVRGIRTCISFRPTLPAGAPPTFSIALPTEDGTVVLDMALHSVRGDRHAVLVDRGLGPIERWEASTPRTYRGTIRGEPGSIVAGSLLADGFSGMAWRDNGAILAVQPRSELEPEGPFHGEHVCYLPEDADEPRGSCGTTSAFRVGDPDDGRQASLVGQGARVVELACETDHEYFLLNFSSVAVTIDDIERVVNLTNVMYERDAQISHEIGTVVVRTSASDPYVGQDMNARLLEFGATWGAPPESGIFRDVAHMFSGFSYPDSLLGLAWVGVVCNPPNDRNYAVSWTRFTTAINWRVALTAHELGHQWNASHCNEDGPDNCHVMCSNLNGCGGIGGANLRFDARAISEIRAWVESRSCDSPMPVPVQPPFSEAFPGLSIEVARWPYNDGCSTTSVAVGEPSPPYSMVLNSSGPLAYDEDEIRSAPIVLGSASAVRVRFHVSRSSVEAGEALVVEYRNRFFEWALVERIVSDGAAVSGFALREHVLGGDACHSSFRLRFRTEGNETNDGWFVDDVTVEPVAPPDPCPADLNDDGAVDGADLGALLASWGQPGPADLDGNGVVDGVDLGSLLAAWGPC
jgi:hypothetical protein